MKRTAGALLALAVLLGSAGCGGGDHVAAPDVLSLEKAAKKAAVKAATASMTYNYATIDADFNWVDKLATRKFQKDFAAASKPVRQAVEAGDVDARAQVLEAATDYRDSRHIDVLLFVDQSLVSEKDKADRSAQEHRVKMSMLRQGDRWLVDSVQVVDRTTTADN